MPLVHITATAVHYFMRTRNPDARFEVAREVLRLAARQAEFSDHRGENGEIIIRLPEFDGRLIVKEVKEEDDGEPRYTAVAFAVGLGVSPADVEELRKSATADAEVKKALEAAHAANAEARRLARRAELDRQLNAMSKQKQPASAPSAPSGARTGTATTTAKKDAKEVRKRENVLLHTSLASVPTGHKLAILAARAATERARAAILSGERGPLESVLSIAHVARESLDLDADLLHAAEIVHQGMHAAIRMLLRSIERGIKDPAYLTTEELGRLATFVRNNVPEPMLQNIENVKSSKFDQERA